MMGSGNKDNIVYLIDFGLSKFLEKGESLSSKVGTPYYVSPDVLSGEYDSKCDMWSLGVITYALLCGYPAFTAPSHAEIFRKIQCAEYTFNLTDWENISTEGKEFIKKLLVINPQKRLSAE